MKYLYNGQEYDKPAPGQRFESGQWDIDAIINRDDGGNGTYERLFALCILWNGRTNDINERHKGTISFAAETYKQCADELHQALQVIFGENS